ncbi:efflux ABC transporter permease protein [Alistipes sp. CAG:514]|nr:efflux ABC transporter permease protein [Alistipes sp. CAG:514]
MGMRRKSDLIIKVLSLGVGMAIAVILIAKVCFELSYDNVYKDIDRIYKIRTGAVMQGEDKDFGQVSGAIAPGFKAEVPGVLEATRFTSIFNSENFIIDDDGSKVAAEHLLADSCFFRIFNRQFLAGEPEKALRSWSGDVAISKTFAEKLGGVGAAVGKQIANEDNPNLKLTVCGVYEDFPKNGSIHADVILSIEAMSKWSLSNWVGNDRYVAFVKLAEGVDPASLKDAIHEMQKAHQPLEEMEKSGLTLWYFLSPLATEHSSKPEVRNLVFILAIIAALLLLVSIMNYVLVAISDVIRRAREVGVRKCYGAESWDINRILLRETACNLGLSLAVAAALVLAFRGAIESLLGVPVQDLITPLSVWIVICVVVLVFLVSAIIPAQMFTRIPISSAFRGYKESKRRWKISLLSFQFAINAVLVSLVLIVSFQYRKVLNTDPGYEYRNLVYETFPSYDQTKMNAIAGALRSLPEVEAAELTYTMPFEKASGNNVYLPGDDRELFNIADEYGASEGFFDMMGFRLVEGSVPKGPNDVAVSKSFVTKMAAFADWSDGAVGKIVNISEHDQVTICGVYEDYVIGDVTDMDERPSVRFCWNRDFYTEADKDVDKYDWSGLMHTIVIKLSEVTPAAMRKVEKTIREVAPDSDAEVKAYSETLVNMYDSTKQMKRTYELGALFALLIAVIGLISYVRDENYRRSAEIAVRKVNGAQSSEIVSMLVMDVLKVALVAVLIGDAGAWLVAHYWLQQFAVKIALNPLFFIAADIIVLAIIVSVIVIGSMRIAHTNPVESLKNE